MKEIVPRLEALTAEEGFPLMGIASAQESDAFARFSDWLDRGYYGTMSYLVERREAYRHPDSVLPDCKSVVMLAMPYAANPDTFRPKGFEDPSSRGPGVSPGDAQATPGETPGPRHAEARHAGARRYAEGRIGNYAIGSVDYHDTIRAKLNKIIVELQPHYPESHWRGVVDTAPLLERDYARLAGLGWIGKNTLLLNREWGSYFFLAALLTDLELPAVSPSTEVQDHCGTCTACLDVCPTSAFPKARVLDATRCISYLTIESKGRFPDDLREGVGEWIFGCDLCQIVCPWNRKRNHDYLEVFAPDREEEKRSLAHWLTLDEETFRKLYKRTPFWRTRLRGMQRNALIAAGNLMRKDLLGAIARLCESDDEVIAESARWAKKKIEGE